MTRARLFQVSAAAAAISIITFSGANASGGGGGGGGFSPSPSASAPSYNVVEEYRHAVQSLEDGKYRDAERSLDHVLTVAPKEPNSLYMMGLVKVGENDLKGAERSFERAVRADPDHIGAHRQLALTEAKLGQTEKATTELAKLKAREASCGDACPQAVQLKAAVTEVEASLAPAPPATAPPTAPAPAAAGVAPATPAETKSSASLMFASPEHGDQAYLSAVKLINLHKYNEALLALKDAQIAFGPHPDILTYMGFVNRKLGHLHLAESYYQQVFSLAPNHVGATEYLGELKVVEGDMPGAKRLLAKLETVCAYGCVEEDDLRRWIVAGREP